MQPDTIIPDLASPQSLNRYSYVTNRPINFNDPTGHKACGNTENGKCDDSDEKFNKLLDFVENKIMNKNGKIKKPALDASVLVMKKAAQLFGNDWNKFMGSTTFVFNGTEWRHSATMLGARYRGDKEGDVFRGYFTEDYISPGDSGFHSEFQDGGNQIYHFWAGFATAFNPDPYPSVGGNNAYLFHDRGIFVASAGNFYHDYLFDRPWKGDGVSVSDYALTVTAIDIASHAGPNGSIKTPMELANVVEFQLGTSGGSNGFVGNWSWAWKTPFEK